MNIYFAGSIRGGRDDKEKYKMMIDMLRSYGLVLTEHIGFENLDEQGQQELTEEYIYTQDTDWIQDSDIVVAEVTQPSLGVGYELGFAEAIGKRVVCLFNTASGRSLSAMIRGNEYFEIIDYRDIDELPAIFEKIFE